MIRFSVNWGKNTFMSFYSLREVCLYPLIGLFFTVLVHDASLNYFCFCSLREVCLNPLAMLFFIVLAHDTSLNVFWVFGVQPGMRGPSIKIEPFWWPFWIFNPEYYLSYSSWWCLSICYPKVWCHCHEVCNKTKQYSQDGTRTRNLQIRSLKLYHWATRDTSQYFFNFLLQYLILTNTNRRIPTFFYKKTDYCTLFTLNYYTSLLLLWHFIIWQPN